MKHMNGMSYTTGDFYTNGTSGLGAYRKPTKKYQQKPAIKKYTMNGVGAMVVQNDFGGMGDMGFSVFGYDVGAEATKLYQQTLKNLQSQATTAATSAVQNFVVKLTGANGQVQNVNLTPSQAAAYQQTGVLPVGLLPAGFVAAPPTFMEQYGKYIMIAGGILAGIIAISLIVKMKNK
jgi:hypothetical protein